MRPENTPVSRTNLVVGDDRDIARLLEMHLQDVGYTVTIAGNGIAGFRAVPARLFDLILLDLILPGMDGLVLCWKLRAQRGIREPPAAGGGD